MLTRQGKNVKSGQEEPDEGASASAGPDRMTEAKAEEKLEELAGLVKSLIRSQAVRDQHIEKESSRQEQRWRRMQHQFLQIQQQVNRMKDEPEPEYDTLEEGQPPRPGGYDDGGDNDDDDDDDPGEMNSQMSLGFRPQREPLAHREPKLLPLGSEDDIEHFLTTFERMAHVCRWSKDGWAVRLVPLLTGKARSAYVLMDMKDSGNYDKVKASILAKYEITPDTYRRRFRSLRIEPGETPQELYVRLKDMFSKWVKPEKSTVKGISETMILEQFLRMVHPELEIWIREHDPKTAEEAARLAEVFTSARKGSRSATFGWEDHHAHANEKIEDSWSMSVGFHSRTFSSLSTPNINKASSKDVTASLHRNVLSWGVWRGKEEKESVSLRAITQSASSQTVDSGSYSGVTNLFRAASVPDVVRRTPKSAFTSITIAVQRTLPSLSTPQDPVYPSTSAQPVMVSTPPKLLKTFGASSIPTSTTRVSDCHLDVCRRNPTVMMPNEFGQAYASADGLAVKDHGKRKAQLEQSRLSDTESDRKQDEIGGSLTKLSLQPSYRSCIHLEVPLRSTSSVVFLDKSLFISLVELEGRRTGQPTLHRSTYSVRLGVSSCRRSSTDNKPEQINEGYRRARPAMLGPNKRNGRESGAGHCRSPLSKHRGYKVEQTAPAHGVNSKAEDSDTQRHSTTLGLLSFRGPSPSNTKAGRQKGNADEAVFAIRSNFKHRQHTSNIGPVDSRTWSKQAKSDNIEEGQEHDCSSEPQKVSDNFRHSRPKADSLEGTPKNLSLKEALELFRPDFISRSQGRVRRLEQRARRRRSLQESNPDLVRGLREDRGKQKRNCTTPDPLSDNLFRPRERSISGREMQLRSRRIYNKLPEVTQKKQEEKKRAVSQTNRLRADVFKKRLLDQILQR